MSADEKKNQPPKGPPPASSSPASQTPPKPVSTPPPAQPVATKGPLISRRAFLAGAVVASAALASAPFAFSQMPGGILNPIIPTPKGETQISTVAEMDSIGTTVPSPTADPSGIMPYKFFYWPYDQSVSPYYKNVLCRIPDPIKDEVTIDGLAIDAQGHKYVAYNTTCVHLQCLVNPGYADGQYRLQCPCHGSQYEIMDAVPQKGPAFLLNLGRLPRVRLSIKNGQIYAEDWDASRTLEGTPGLGVK